MLRNRPVVEWLRRFAASCRPVLALVVLLSWLPLGACQKPSSTAAPIDPAADRPIAALPLAIGAPPSSAPAPTTRALPPPPHAIALRPEPSDRRFRYVDHAYAMSEALGESPPDYMVDQDGTAPWVWRSQNGAVRVVERLTDGERQYYYAPRADHPYLVANPAYLYAYEDGALVGVYDNGGAALPGELAARRADEAARYFERGGRLYRAALHGRRRAAYLADWRERQSSLRQQLEIWREAVLLQPEWQDWHRNHVADEWRQWDQERTRRLAHAARLASEAAVIAVAPANPAPVAQGAEPSGQPRPAPPLAPAATPQTPRASGPAAPPPKRAERSADRAVAKAKPRPGKHRHARSAVPKKQKQPASKERKERPAASPADAPPPEHAAEPPRRKRYLLDRVGDFFERTFNGRRGDGR
jgi:hypothetical protein